MSSEKVRHTLARLASEVVERNRGTEGLRILGIETRGAVLAQRLAREISAIGGREIEVSGLDVQAFRDDLENGGESMHRTDDLTDLNVLLVDDVLQTGRTARAALDAIVQLGRPRSIQFLTLIDRGHREYPIQPDYVGRLLQTKHRERVEVAVDADFEIWIED